MPYIRRATVNDFDELLELAKSTFWDTFAADNSSADMVQYMTTAFARDRFHAQLSAPESVFLLAYPNEIENTAPVGYAHLIENAAVPGWPTAPRAMELSRLYVKQTAIGQGYGSKLMQACLDDAAKNGFETLWLGVWERNDRALTFYRRWQFQQVGTQIFMLGNDMQTDYVLMRPVSPH